jgi:RNA polymerase sigma factor (sigma-70 family)
VPGTAERTIYRRAARFDAEGMASLFPPPKVEKHQRLPAQVRAAIRALKAEHPTFYADEIADICAIRFDQRPSPHTVRRLLAEDPPLTPPVRRFPPYRETTDPAAARLAIVRLHSEGWAVKRSGTVGMCPTSYGEACPDTVTFSPTARSSSQWHAVRVHDPRRHPSGAGRGKGWCSARITGGAGMAGRDWAARRRRPAPATPDAGLARDADTDDALLARGDAAGFITLYRRHLPAVYRYAYARLGNRQDAEDLAALTFERAWAQRGRYDASGPYRGWLFGIAHHAVVDQWRQGRPDTTPVEALAGVLPDPAAGPEAAALTAEERALAAQLLAALRPAQREILALRFFAGLPYDADRGRRRQAHPGGQDARLPGARHPQEEVSR